MREYLDLIWASRELGDYEIRAHLSNHSNPRNLVEGNVSLKDIFSLLNDLNHDNHEMTFDGYLGIVSKVEIDSIQKKIVLQVKLSEASGGFK